MAPVSTAKAQLRIKPGRNSCNYPAMHHVGLGTVSCSRGPRTPFPNLERTVEMKKELLRGLSALTFGIGLSAFSLGACGGGTKAKTAATADPNPCADNPCGENPCGNPCGASANGPMEVGIDWSGWSSWTKVNSEPFVSKGHKKPWVNVYVQPDHASTYAALEGELPEGFAVLKSVHKDADGVAGDVAALTVMVKMGADYDPENGNWYYGVLSPDGSKAMNEGKLEMCIGCHSAADTDYLFGTK